MKTKTQSLRGAKAWLAQLEAMRPVDADHLHRFVEVTLGLRIVRKAVIPGNDAPFDYLVETFFEKDEPVEGGEKATASRDLIVWANRGGGKTLLGAVASLLDMVFKPGIQIRILGGSLQQSSKMYEYLRQMMERDFFRPLVAVSSQRELTLTNGSRVRLLAHSSRSVRGEHVHQLRCDEVDDFKDHIWKAAQLVAQSGRCGDVRVRGTVEAISTMHQPFGPMSRLMDKAADRADSRVIRWSAIDVMARCPAQRPCEGCRLWADCKGHAKEAQGYVPVDEMIARRERTDNLAWAAEMMCDRPRRSATVFPQFDAMAGGPHVQAISPVGRQRQMMSESMLVGGMDFGIRNPFVMLWARMVPPVRTMDASKADADAQDMHLKHWTLEVVDELVEEGLTMDQAVVRMEERGWPRPAWIAADPAGGQQNRQTGISDIRFLKQHGYKIIAKPATIAVGISAIRRRLDRGLLKIDPSCKRLIQDLSQYHFDVEHPQNQNPVKDGSDHACDALRYLVMAMELADAGVRTREW